MKKFEKRNNKYIVSFYLKGNEFQETLSFIKAIPGRYFQPSLKAWEIPVSPMNYQLLISEGFKPVEKKEEINPEAIIIPETPQKEIDVSILPPLRSYQIEGVKFLEAVNGRGMILFDMRLGKSLTALSWTFLHPEESPTLIVCPASAKIGWGREIEKWTDKEYMVLSGKTPYEFNSIPYIIINYDILHDWQFYLKKKCIKTIIIDEVQYMSNRRAKIQDKETGRTKSVTVKRTEALLNLCKGVEHIIPLSGTPFTSYPDKFWNALHLICPDVFSIKGNYLSEFCNPTITPWGITYKGVTNAKKLRSLIAPISIRKRKSDVFDLPKRERIIVPLEIDMRKYEKEAREFDVWYKAHTDASDEEIHKRIEHIKSISYDAKRKQIHSWIEEFLETGQKLVVFCYHRIVVEDIFDKFKKNAVMVYGGMGINERQRAIDSFQKKDVQLFIGQINSTNTAISLSASDTVAFVELPFDPGNYLQAEERIFMPGEKDDRALTSYVLLAANTVDEKRYKALLDKAETFYKVIDGTDEKLEFSGKIK